MKKIFDLLPVYLPLIVVGLIIILAILNGKCSSMAKDAQKSVYKPSRNEGVFCKSDSLFSELLKFQELGIQVKTIDDLNMKYPAFKFSLPYSEDSLTFSHVEDIRCVGINERYLDNLNDQNLKIFYYNSRLPQIFKLQNEETGNRYFKIIAGNDDGLVIRKIQLVPSMFKVSLDNLRCRCSIYGAESPLYPKDSTLFLSCGKIVLPIRIGADENNLDIICNYKKDTLFVKENSNIQLPHKGYYDYCEYYKKNQPRLLLCLDKDKNKKVTLRIGIKSINGGLEVYLWYKKLDNKKVDAIVYSGEERYELKEWQKDANLPNVVDFVDGMKIIVGDNNEKYAELVLTRQNPMCILSAEKKTNKGYERYNINDCYTDVFTQQLLRGLNSALPYWNYNDDITLSVDPILSHELEREMEMYLKKLKVEFANNDKACGGASWDMSLTVMDLKTGNVLASPYVSDRVDKLNGSLKYAQRNTALQRRHIGSTFKPLLALAAVLTNKSLLNLDTRDNKYSYGNPCDFLGTKVGQWAKPTPNKVDHWKGCDFRNFISRSDDVYPAALVALCMNGWSVTDDLSRKRTLTPYPQNSIFKNYKGFLKIKSFEEKELGDYDFLKILDLLYDVYAYGEGDRLGDTLNMPESYVWRNLKRKDTTIVKDIAMDIITPDYTNMNYNKTLQADGASFQGAWVPWILGQGGNDWSCIKLAEAYSRMISKKKIRASLVDGISENEPLDTLLSLHADLGKMRDLSYIKNAWNRFLYIFAEAQKEGTLLKPMYKAVSIVDTSLILFSKTGTPDQYERSEEFVIDAQKQNMDVVYYCFGLMTKKSYKDVINGKQPKGVVCVVRIARKLVNKENGNGLWSERARDFFVEWNKDKDKDGKNTSVKETQKLLKKFYEMTKIYY